MTYQPRLLVDFDGVIHAYSKGWHDGTAYDPPIPSAKRALENLVAAGYEIVIFSTREPTQIHAWLREYGFPAYHVTNFKMPAVALIDDRAIRFHNWGEAMDQVLGLYPIKKEQE